MAVQDILLEIMRAKLVLALAAHWRVGEDNWVTHAAELRLKSGLSPRVDGDIQLPSYRQHGWNPPWAAPNFKNNSHYRG